MSVFGIVFLAIQGFHLARWLLRRAGVLETPPPEPPAVDATSAGWLATLCLPAAVILAVVFFNTHHPGVLVALLVTTTALLPWPLARFVTIPLGLVRTSAALASVARWTFGKDPAGGAALAAVLAALRTQTTTTTTTWLTRTWRRLAHRPDADLLYARTRVQSLTLINGAGVVAAAILADVDDTPAHADALLATLSSFDPRVVPPLSSQLAAERRLHRILAGAADDDSLDVAARVAARRDAALALDAQGASTVFFVQALLRLDATPTDRWRRWRASAWWVLAPRRRHTWSWLRTRPAGWPLPATSLPIQDTVTIPLIDADEGALARALRLHVEAARRPPSIQLAADVALAWERGLEATAANARQRASALGVDGDDVIDGLTTTVQQSLQAMAETLDLSRVDTAALPDRFAIAVAEVRSRRLDALETAAAAWRQRIDGVIDLAPIDELREWVALQELVERVARTGVDGRYVAYEAMQWVVCERAVRLWNSRGERRLANALFRWLLREAERVDDVRGIETQTANVKCGPS